MRTHARGDSLEHVGVVLLGVLLIAACASNRPIPAATPQGPSRTIADFSFLQLGMSYDEIVARVGEPDQDVGSGMYVFVYTLDDGRELNLTFASLNHLASAFVYNPRDGSREWILGPEGG